MVIIVTVIIVNDMMIVIVMDIMTTIHPVSITRFPLRRFSPGADLLRNPFVHIMEIMKHHDIMIVMIAMVIMTTIIAIV